MAVVVSNTQRTDLQLVDALSKFGVATIHEAQGRIGLLAAHLRPIYRPVRVAGNALTCEVAPGDNWSIHVAVESFRVPTSQSRAQITRSLTSWSNSQSSPFFIFAVRTESSIPESPI